jgi:alkylation response protein AidB-like acyl-CoA dehydrogenase
VRPIVLLDGEPEVNEVFFDNVEVPAENLIGEENKGWTYAKHLLSHERTNIADVNRAKRELERLKRIAKAEGRVGRRALPRPDRAAGGRHRGAGDDGAARAVGREERQAEPGRGRPAEDPRQRDPAALHRADDAGRRPLRHALHPRGDGSRLAGRPRRRPLHCAPLAGTYFNMRKTTIYGGSNEVQRNIVSQTVLGS